MASIKTKFAVGIFVAIGLALTVVAVVWLGMSHYLEGGRLYALYFDESVQGLDKDSPVKYRGVTIGRVHRIGVAPDSKLIEVIVKIETDLEQIEDTVAELKSVGITGIMFIELDVKPASGPDHSPTLSFTPNLPVIATKPSEIRAFFAGLDDVLTQFKQLNIDRVTTRLNAVLDEMQRAIVDMQLPALSTRLRSTIVKLETALAPEKWDQVMAAMTTAADAITRAGDAVEKTGRQFGDLAPGAGNAIADISATAAELKRLIRRNTLPVTEAIAQLKATIAAARTLANSGDQFVLQTDDRFARIEQRLSGSLDNLEHASTLLNRFLERIADQPSQLLFGRPAPGRNN